MFVSSRPDRRPTCRQTNLPIDPLESSALDRFAGGLRRLLRRHQQLDKRALDRRLARRRGALGAKKMGDEKTGDAAPGEGSTGRERNFGFGLRRGGGKPEK